MCVWFELQFPVSHSRSVPKLLFWQSICRDCQPSLSTQFLSPLPVRHCNVLSFFRALLGAMFNDTVTTLFEDKDERQRTLTKIRRQQMRTRGSLEPSRAMLTPHQR